MVEIKLKVLTIDLDSKTDKEIAKELNAVKITNVYAVSIVPRSNLGVKAQLIMVYD